jgi:putative endonuclease
MPACAGMSGCEIVMAFYVYMLASRRNGTLYVGMTDDLVKRVWRHRSAVIPGFTKQYGVKVLVWFEQHESRESAFARERRSRNGTVPGS